MHRRNIILNTLDVIFIGFIYPTHKSFTLKLAQRRIKLFLSRFPARIIKIYSNILMLERESTNTSQENLVSPFRINPEDYNPPNSNELSLTISNDPLPNLSILIILNQGQSGLSIGPNPLPISDPKIFRWLFQDLTFT